MAQMAPWKTLLQESLRKNAKLRHSKYMQVATVRPDGRPANRSVVYRGFFHDTDKLTFVTDLRSHKVTELAASPWSEIAWYFPDTREQYRLLGTVKVITHQEQDEVLLKARHSAWRAMSDPGRQQFLWPEPGIPRPEDDIDANLFNNSGGDQGAATIESPVAEPFCLCIVDVDEVDHLQLKSNQRSVYKKRDGDEWVAQYVNP